MIIYYRKSLGYLSIITAWFLLIFYLYLRSLNGNLILIMMSLLFGGGYYQLNKPYFLFDNKSFKFSNLFGSVVKVYKFMSIDDVSLIDNNIYVPVKGRRKKLPITKILITNTDWQNLLDQIELKKKLSRYQFTKIFKGTSLFGKYKQTAIDK